MAYKISERLHRLGACARNPGQRYFPKGRQVRYHAEECVRVRFLRGCMSRRKRPARTNNLKTI